MRAIAIVGLILATADAAYADQDRLGVAKDLYASAAYEDALSALAQLTEGATPDIARQIDQYRTFCLFALGRTTEAEQVAEALIRKDPLAMLNDDEVSPRIEAMFTNVKKRLLPVLIREEYRVARSAVDGKDLARAEPHLQLTSRMLAEARSVGAMDDTLTDLSLVVDGFLNLARATTEQQLAKVAVSAPAAVAAPAAPAPTPPAPRPSQELPVTALRQASAPGTAPIYAGSGDAHLSPPVVISQLIPELPPSIAASMRGATRKTVVLELTINERGDVQDVVMTEPAQPLYDQIVLKAARLWKYRPATLDGVPVKFKKSVTVAFRDQ